MSKFERIKTTGGLRCKEDIQNLVQSAMSGSQEISFSSGSIGRVKTRDKPKTKPSTACESPGKSGQSIPKLPSTQDLPIKKTNTPYRSASTEAPRKTTEIKAIERYEATKSKQSAELLALLDKEQEAESYRELKLSAITDEE